MASKKRGASASPRRRSAAEMQKWYNENKSKLQAFEDSNDAIKQLRDISRNTAKTINSVDKETVVGYLQNPSANQANLRNVSWYLYTRNSVYKMVVDYFANMLCLDARVVIPSYDPTATSNDDQSALKSWVDTIKMLEPWPINNEFHKVMTYCLIQDLACFVAYYDQDGFFLLPLPPEYTRIYSVYPDCGDYVVYFNTAYFNSRQDFLEAWGYPFDEMVKTAASQQGSSASWVQIPPEVSACFKINDSWDSIIPPFSNLFGELIDLQDLSDIQAVANQQEIFKLLYLKLQTMNNATLPDSWKIDPKTVVSYFQRMVDECIPDYVSAAVIPTNSQVGQVSFTESDKATQDNKVLKAQQNVLSSAGVSHILGQVSGTSAYENAMIANSEIGLRLLSVFEKWFNRIAKNMLPNPAKIHFLHVTPYTKKQMRKDLLEDGERGLPTKTAIMSLDGSLNQLDVLSLNNLENKILGLGDKFNEPLTTSFTQSGNSSQSAGAPEKDADQLTDQGSRSRQR